MGLHELETGRGHGGRGEGFGDEGCDCGEAVRRLAAAFEDGGVAGFEGQRGDVGDDFWAGLEDDEEHADGARDAGEGEIVVQQGAGGDFVD